jgi:hypothetical protein
MAVGSKKLSLTADHPGEVTTMTVTTLRKTTVLAVDTRRGRLPKSRDPLPCPVRASGGSAIERPRDAYWITGTAR